VPLEPVPEDDVECFFFFFAWSVPVLVSSLVEPPVPDIEPDPVELEPPDEPIPLWSDDDPEEPVPPWVAELPEDPDPIDEELPDDLLLSSVPEEPDEPVDDCADAAPAPSAARAPARNSRSLHLMCASLPCRTQAQRAASAS
jgi:hypothetical protein